MMIQIQCLYELFLYTASNDATLMKINNVFCGFSDRQGLFSVSVN